MKITFGLSGEPRGAPLSIERLSEILNKKSKVQISNINLIRHAWLSSNINRNKLTFKSFQSEQRTEFIKTNKFFISEINKENKKISYIVMKPKVILCEFIQNNINTDVVVLGRNDYFWPDNILELCLKSFETQKILIPKKEQQFINGKIQALNDQLLIAPVNIISKLSKAIDKSIQFQPDASPEICLANVFQLEKDLNYDLIEIKTKFSKDRWGSERHNLIRKDKKKWDKLHDVDYGRFAFIRHKLSPLKKILKTKKK